MVGRPRDSLTLTDTERGTLRRWAESPSSTQAQALRARIVLACERLPTSIGVAAELGVSRDTVALWRSRFLAERLDGLCDQPRPGRPKAVPETAADEILHTMLQRPLHGRASWSTRSVAAATGLSQTTVSRIWRTWWPSPTAADSPAHELLGVHFGPALRVLALRRPVDSVARAPRNGLPTVLAAAEHCRRAAPAGEAEGNAIRVDIAAAAASLRAFLALLDGKVPAPVDVQLIVDAEELGRGAGLGAGPLAGWRRQHRFSVEYTSTRAAWQARARNVIGLAEVAEQVHRWPAANEREFTWVREDLPAPSPAKSGMKNDSRAHTTPVVGQVAFRGGAAGASDGTPRLADQVVYALKEAIAAGQFAAGERITEAPLAARLGVSRGPVRDALRTLAEAGLLELLPNKGALIPTIHAADVLETYASRAALGDVLLRRLVTLEPAALKPVSAALDEARTAVRLGDAQVMVEADTVFQDAFADAAQLPRTALHFRNLSMQLRMFVSILGLDYADAGERVVRQDAAILDALHNRSGNDAVRHWRAKIEYMVRYMAAQLPQEDFDARLWLTIAGHRPGPGQ
ncbi:GntR family transcriptional regulator [Streptomyces sp. LHD-70]|uniref:GntR family transcriptional regulator n=1 Tax=Streptomyces sp. LHD-70 TaxID=3072140 RepID=UPI00280D83EB|nr:GntR family transcriptional regulator [Streptomyces sp. LHD-70]MDQ8705143.1 GntR family transcriptional regulator [Streptomyces sp. LHD-70]